MGIVSVFFIALYALNARCLLILNSGREAVAAQQALHDRVEQLRSCTWAQITSASYLQSSLLCTATNSSANLSSPTESVTVNAYATTISPQVKVVRSGGSASTVTSNVAMVSQEMVRIDVSLAWVSRPGGRQRTQAATIVISKS